MKGKFCILCDKQIRRGKYCDDICKYIDNKVNSLNLRNHEKAELISLAKTLREAAYEMWLIRHS